MRTSNKGKVEAKAMKENSSEDLSILSEKELIDKMATVMAGSIAKLLQPCIEQRCKQFLTLMNKGGILGEGKSHDRF